ncbi:WAT1-related protein At3g30340-like [Punica granatum]|uniref:WAT1-related protein n=2 Tax=Punica granatum TaxID=22663 RepID=A0A218WHE3_PUNGR|nr:WAT1-related protein At3g30340-like [Punica granatum]OWM72247.1 hypothetical protein CDL15_Pgr018132 [Punica granatum]PKI31224.1 hypothetical protein CRG98_048385 [Punica granatum]
MAEGGDMGGAQWAPYIAMIAIEFAFAVVNVMLKKVLEEGMNHLVLIAYRQAVSTLFLSPLAYFLERNSRPKLTFRIVCLLFFSAIVGSSLTQYFFLIGIQYTSATFACAFINMVPVVTFIMALPFRMEQVNLYESSGKAKVMGSLICVVGVMVLTFYRGITLFSSLHAPPRHPSMAYHSEKLSSAKRTEKWVISSMTLVLASVLWSSWFLLQSNIGQRYPCKYSSTAIMSFFGTVQSTALVGMSSGRNLSAWMFKETFEIITVLFTGIVGSGLCYVGMTWCVKKRGPVFTAAFSPLIQIITAMIDIPLLHESLHVGSVIGSLLVIIGLYILLWGKNKEAKDSIKRIAQEAEEVKEEEPKLQVITVSSDSRCS